MSENEVVTFNMGAHYEEKLVQALLVDSKFAEQMTEILNVDYFGLEYLKEICKLMFSHYDAYRTFPSIELIKTIIAKNDNEVLRNKIHTFFNGINKDFGDIEWIKENALEFCRKRSVLISLEKILEYANNKKYNDIIPEIQKALVAGSERDMGHSYLDDFEMRMQKSTYKPIPTPWKIINDLIKGGLGAGKLACICAPTGTGKTHSLVDIGCAAAQLGFTVIHYTLELSECDTGNRYDSRISNVAIDSLIENKALIKENVSKLPGKVIIKSYATKSATVSNIKNHIHKLKMKGVNPDILIIDYADLMRSRKSYELKRLEEESVYEELRGLAMEMDIPIWTATQSNRASLDAEVITLKDIAECFAKAMICDFFLTINRKKDGNQYSNIGNMFVAKSRLGKDGLKYSMLMDTSKSRIEIFEADALEQEADSDSERLRKKLKSFLSSDHKTNKPEEDKIN